MSWKRDLTVIASVGVLAAGLISALDQLGLSIPVVASGYITLGAAIGLGLARVYVRIVGPENTKVDEVVDAIAAEVTEDAALIRKP